MAPIASVCNRMSSRGGVGGGASALLTDLVSYWKLEEDAQADRQDSHGAFHLTQNGGVGRTTGKINFATQFSGGQYLSRAHEGNLSGTGTSFTVAGWFLTNSAGDQAFAAKWTSGTNQREYLVYQTASRFKLLVSANGSSSSTVSADTFGAPSTGVAYFLAAGYDVAAQRIWIQVNAGTRDQAVYSSGIFAGNSPFYLGAYSGIFALLNGWIDEVGFWRRSLSTTEVSQLYAGGNGLAYPFA
jgi:hypothetical protein